MLDSSARQKRNDLLPAAIPAPPRRSAATLRDVAAHAGVNAATASVVLNNTRSGTRVSLATRDRILKAAAELRYRPNAAARGMKRRRMDTIGVVSIIDGAELNLYFLELLNGILEAAAQHHNNTIVFSISEWREDERRLLDMCDGRVDGMILIGPWLRLEFAETLREHTPFITIHGEGDVPNTGNLDVDNEAAAYAMVRYLIGQGHRRILHLTGQMESSSARQRIVGYRLALEADGIPYDESLIVPCRFSQGAGRRQMEELLDERRFIPLPTAIFCASDAIACGCLEALAARRLRVPEDISVAGFDDTLAARMTMPLLTTIRQPFRAMGRRAVELLFAQIAGDTAAPVETTADSSGPPTSVVSPHTVLFDAELIVRGSVGIPPATRLSPDHTGES